MIQTEEKPRIRKDLQCCPRQTPEGSVFVIKDPVTGRFFQFRETEHAILQLLDGEASLKDIREQVAKERKCELDAETLKRFVEQLKRTQLLDSGDSKPSPAGARRRIRGSILYLRMMAFDPDRFFAGLTPRLGFFFTLEFVLLSAAVIMMALAITYGDWSEIRQGFRAFAHLQWLVAAWLILLSVTTLHEFAHRIEERLGRDIDPDIRLQTQVRRILHEREPAVDEHELRAKEHRVGKYLFEMPDIVLTELKERRTARCGVDMYRQSVLRRFEKDMTGNVVLQP